MFKNSTSLSSKTLISSPLEQFCDEETDASGYVKQNVSKKADTLGFIEEVELFIVFSITSFSNLILIYFVVEDDENVNNEWNDMDLILTTNQGNILVSNMLGAIPGSETQTSELSLVLFYSFSTVITCIIIGFVIHGVRYLSVIFPGGMYLVMAPFILAIEFISFLARAISLGMRLFANMFAGHSLFKILYAFSWVTLISPFFFFSIIILTLVFALIILEIGIAYLQGYVYGSLASMYFSESITLAH